MNSPTFSYTWLDDSSQDLPPGEYTCDVEVSITVDKHGNYRVVYIMSKARKLYDMTLAEGERE